MESRKSGLPVALVTGGARRIGRAVAEDLGANGFAVAVHCRDSRAEADAVVTAIRENGGVAEAVCADLAVMEGMRGLVEAVHESLGPVRLLVNNASVFEDDSPEDAGADVWHRHFAVHLQAPSILAAELARLLPEGSDGLVVNFADQRVRRLNPKFYSYTLSKAAMWTATQTLAQALAPRVRVNAIGPGPTMPSPRQSREDFERQASAVLLGRGPCLEEFGKTVRWLWEAKSVTGQLVALDGGQHLAWETPDTAGAE